jgi:hypothetical protein
MQTKEVQLNDYVDRFKADYWSKLRRGTRLSSACAAIGLIAFFLPWVTASRV